MPLIQRFHPNLEENVEEEYVEAEDKGEDESGSGETKDDSMDNNTRNFTNENFEGIFGLITYKLAQLFDLDPLARPYLFKTVQGVGGTPQLK